MIEGLLKNQFLFSKFILYFIKNYVIKNSRLKDNSHNVEVLL